MTAAGRVRQPALEVLSIRRGVPFPQVLREDALADSESEHELYAMFHGPKLEVCAVLILCGGLRKGEVHEAGHALGCQVVATAGGGAYLTHTQGPTPDTNNNCSSSILTMAMLLVWRPTPVISGQPDTEV